MHKILVIYLNQEEIMLVLHLLLVVFAGGDAGPTTDTINFVTIATTRKCNDFGNLSAARETAGTSSSTRGVFWVEDTLRNVNIIEYITISTTWRCNDFGDLSARRNW